MSLRDRPGLALALVGVALFVGYTGVTAATAPSVNAAERDVTTGPMLVSTFSPSDQGSVSYVASDGTTEWQHSGPVSYTGASRLPSGNVLVGYQDRHNGSAITGIRVLTPGNRTVWDYNYSIATGRNSEVHDVERLPDGDFVVAGMDRERVFVVNRSTKTIEWQWNASSFYEEPEDPLTRDWLHINDVDRIGDGRYLVSVRNSNQLLIIERGAGVVEVINKDRRDGNGGNCVGMAGRQLVSSEPRCGDPEVLNHQHNPQWLGGGAVLVADSENDRVVELHRTESREWEVAWTATGANGVPFDWPRDADRLANGNTLVLDTRNARLVEVTQSGNVEWTTSIPEESYSGVRGGAEYPAGPQYNVTGMSVGAASGQPFETADALYGAIRYTFALPFWVTSWHVVVGFIGTMLVIYGSLWDQLRDSSPDIVSALTDTSEESQS